MTWWPGWDSVADSGWWAQFWFAISFVSLVGFGASQLLSHVYGSRTVELAAADQIAARSRLAHATGVETPHLAPPVQPEDRHINERQRQIIADALRPIADLRLSLVLLEDEEAAIFGEEILDALQNAGVTLTGLSRRNVLLPAPVGVRIWYKENDPAAAALLAAFRRAEIPVTPIRGRLGNQAAHIVVGVKTGSLAGKRISGSFDSRPDRFGDGTKGQGITVQ